MKFIVNTKTLINAISLGIISSNVNRFDHKSTLVQLSAKDDYLIITLGSNMISSEMTLVGSSVYESGEEDLKDTKRFTKLVDTLLFKQLALSFDKEETEIIFLENGIELHSGKSKFVVPQIVDSEDMTLSSPDYPQVGDTEIEFNKDDWDFIKNHQLFAVSKVFTRPVYTYVYTDRDGHVIAGDMDNALFTLSNKINLGRDCLLSDKIINLFNSVPNGSKLVEHGDGFIMSVEGEGFNYVSEFVPKYEDESDVGVYNAEVFLSMMQTPDSGYCSFEPSLVNKFLSQISFITNSPNEFVHFVVNGTELTITNQTNNKSTFPIGGDCEYFELSFKLATIKDVISNYPSEEINMSPLTNPEGELAGILIWDDELVTMLAAVED